jgi:hypothetical protein
MELYFYKPVFAFVIPCDGVDRAAGFVDAEGPDFAVAFQRFDMISFFLFIFPNLNTGQR